MSQLGDEHSRRGGETPTFMDLLRDQMEGQDRPRRRKRTLRERLRFKGIGCCGPAWSFRQSTIGVRENEDEEEEIDEDESGRTRIETGSDSGMNLAAALAAERHHRVPSGEPDGSMTPLRVSLLRLLEETTEKENGRMTASVGSNDSLCCVCMVKKKGAAFIPCGHTFCRVCSRELWLNRGSCPVCNRPILEILDIY